ncbi:Dynamin-like GTPase that mediates homotypic ER fusion [Coelomomyces lativittatus]|nr:Dynamin-like GTPase that mediates homotypic ER fusion [Coelomomyces lativittatus]KAJ1509483.1 Dynamin-like GTPase that mediates homotypic ER fusion [Coelomomyces lativittatus]
MKDATWPTEELETQLTQKLDELIDAKDKQILEEHVETTLKKAKTDLKDVIESVFRHKKPPQDVESKVNSLYEHIQLMALEQLSKGCTEMLNMEVTPLKADFQAHLKKELKGLLLQQTQDAVLIPKLRVYFEELFRFDADGLPRFWKPSDDMAAVYRHARAVVTRYLTQLSTYRLPDTTEPFLIPEDRLSDITTRFKLEADVMYMDAKRSLLLVTPHIPKWLMLLLLILGWNELVYLLSSPLLLIFFILVLGLGYALVWSGLAGPILQVLTKVYHEVSTQLYNRFIHQQQQQQQQHPSENLDFVNDLRRSTIKSPTNNYELNQYKRSSS